MWSGLEQCPETNLTWGEAGWQGLYLVLNKAIVNVN